MSQTLTRETIGDKATILTNLELIKPAAADHTFEMPLGLYAATAACYFGFLVIMALAVSTPGLIIPIAICGVFIAMFFAVPIVILRQTPEAAKLAKSWNQLRSRGISTYTGHLSGTEAAVQMMILPVLVLGWGLAMAVIIALV